MYLIFKVVSPVFTTPLSYSLFWFPSLFRNSSRLAITCANRKLEDFEQQLLMLMQLLLYQMLAGVVGVDKLGVDKSEMDPVV